jgi:hypothetical protein
LEARLPVESLNQENERRIQMLFMTIATYEPSKRDAIIKRRLEKGRMTPRGMKVLGEWSAVGGGQVFMLVEMEKDVGTAAALPWSDLMELDIIPVAETEKTLRALRRRQRK